MARATKKEIEDFIECLKTSADDPNDLAPSAKDIDMLVEVLKEFFQSGDHLDGLQTGGLVAAPPVFFGGHWRGCRGLVGVYE